MTKFNMVQISKRSSYEAFTRITNEGIALNEAIKHLINK